MHVICFKVSIERRYISHMATINFITKNFFSLQIIMNIVILIFYLRIFCYDHYTSRLGYNISIGSSIYIFKQYYTQFIEV
jgi:hypothetical protein